VKKGKIKVIHICDKFGTKGSSVHGVTRLFSWWFPRFDKNYFDVKLIGLRKADHGCEYLKQNGIDIISLNKGKFNFSTVNKIVQIVKQQKMDILHLHGYGASNFGRMAAKITKVKNIVHEHIVDPAIPKYQIPFDFFLSHLTDMGMANCRSVMNFMVNERFIVKEKIKVVFNGAPLSNFKPIAKDIVEAEKKKWNIPEEYRIVASIGRLDIQKGNQYLINAVTNTINNFNKVKFMIIGDGPLLNCLKNQCKRYGIERDVIFTGFHSNIPLILSMTDIIVIPSLWEGTTLTVFEAMSMGLPIISTKVDGLEEILRNEENALLVPPKNSEAIEYAINKILTNPRMAEVISSQAQKDSSNYDIQTTVDHIQRAYDELMRSD